MQDAGPTITAIVLLLFGLAIYLLPTYIAMQRKHNNTTPIVLINIFLGWSLLGWVIALAWACANPQKPSDASAAHQPEGGDAASQIERLAKLKEAGHISEEEFQAEKEKVLSSA